MNKFPSIDKKTWKTTIKALTIPLKVSVFIVLFPIKLTHHSVKSGVDYVFKGTKLNSKQLETISKVFEYLAYFAWGQNLLEPPRVSRRPNFLREYPNEKYLLT